MGFVSLHEVPFIYLKTMLIYFYFIWMIKEICSSLLRLP